MAKMEVIRFEHSHKKYIQKPLEALNVVNSTDERYFELIHVEETVRVVVLYFLDFGD